MAQIQKFFSTDKAQNELREINRKLSQMQEGDQSSNQKARHLALVVNIFRGNADQVDEFCQQNIKWIGGPLTTSLQNIGDLEKEFGIDSLFSMVYRFVVEFDLSTKNDLSFELKSFLRFTKDNLEKFSADAQEQILYARQEMPVSILKELLNHDELGNLRNVSAFSNDLDKKFEGWESSLKAHEKTIESFQLSLQKQETAFNFVGLYAFRYTQVPGA